MQNTSSLYKEIVAKPDHYFESKLTIELENDTATLFENQIMSMNGNNNVFPRGNPQVGYAISGELDVVILKQNFAIPRAAKIRPYVRACIVEQGEEKKSEWLPKGVFYIDTRKESVNSVGVDTMTIHAYDAMLKFDNPYPSDTQNNYPMTDITMVRFLANQIGITVDSRTVSVMNLQYTFPLPVGYTSREMLGYIAGSYGGNFIITEAGELRLLKLRDLPKNMSTLISPDGQYLLFGNTRILLFSGSN